MNCPETQNGESSLMPFSQFCYQKVGEIAVNATPAETAAALRAIVFNENYKDIPNRKRQNMVISAYHNYRELNNLPSVSVTL